MIGSTNFFTQCRCPASNLFKVDKGKMLHPCSFKNRIPEAKVKFVQINEQHER